MSSRIPTPTFLPITPHQTRTHENPYKDFTSSRSSQNPTCGVTTPVALDAMERTLYPTRPIHLSNDPATDKREEDGKVSFVVTKGFLSLLTNSLVESPFEESLESPFSSSLTTVLPTPPPYIAENNLLATASCCLTPKADENFIIDFEKELFPLLEKALSLKSSGTFKNELRLFLIGYFMKYKNGTNRPECVLNLWTDLREQSFSYLKNKYFSSSYEEDMNSLNLPAFVIALSKIFNCKYPKLDISPLLEGEITETITEIRDIQLSIDAAKKDEAMRLLIYQKTLQLKEEGKTLNAHVLALSELLPFLKSIDTNGFRIAYRVQVIVRSVAHHYTGLDLELTSDGRWVCFIMDASKSLEIIGIKRALKKGGINTIVEAYSPPIDNEEKLLQSDKHSCWLFSLDHVIQSSKIDNLLKFLMSKTQVIYDKESRVSWFSLPNQFIRNAQSTSILTVYSEENPEAWNMPYKDFSSFGEYIESKIQEVNFEGKTGKRINTNAMLRAASYRAIIKNLLDTLPLDDIAAITTPNLF